MSGSTIAGLHRGDPFNPIEEFKGEYRCIAADLRNANAGQSSGPLEIDRPWDSYTDDHLGLMDHLGIDKFMVLGFCIAGPFIWNLLERAPDRVVAAVPVQPSGFRPEMPNLFLREQHGRLGGGIGQAPARHHDGHGRQIPDEDVPDQPRLRLDRDTRFRAHSARRPVLVLPDDTPGHSLAVAMECAMLAPKAQQSIYPWKEPKERIPLAVRHIRSFLRAHRPASV